MTDPIATDAEVEEMRNTLDKFGPKSWPWLRRLLARLDTLTATDQDNAKLRAETYNSAARIAEMIGRDVGGSDTARMIQRALEVRARSTLGGGDE